MEKEYLDLLRKVLRDGRKSEDRTGTGTISLFGSQIRCDLTEGFPAITTKKLAWRSVVGELLWFLEGSTDERRLAELTFGKDRTELVGKRTIWTDNADHQGRDLGYVNNDLYKGLGPVYGAQWRDFGQLQYGNLHDEHSGFDQIRWIIDEIRANPDSRRLIISAWAADRIHSMALPPCHYSCIFRVGNNKLNCMLIMRSNDLFLGAPFNIASYALLTHILARETGLEVGELIYTIGDAHIYSNHVDQVNEQLSKTPFDPPKLYIEDDFDLEEVLRGDCPLDTVSKIRLLDYEHHPFIKAPMSV